MTVEWLDRIINTKKEIKRLENSISNELDGLKELILKRLNDLKEIHDELGIVYGGYGNPNPNANGHFIIFDITLHDDYSVEFSWSNSFAYGGYDEGHTSFTAEEFVNGDFSNLKEKLKNKEE